MHGGWLEENQLIRDAGRLKGIPGVIVHGRYDMPCPARYAWALHKAWPEADFHLIEGAGHSLCGARHPRPADPRDGQVWRETVMRTVLDVAPSVLPDISPTRGEIGRVAAWRWSRTAKIGESHAAGQSPHLWGRCPAGQRGARRSATRQDVPMTNERLYLFDTTLRDGQQTPGIDFSVEDKIAIAKLLDDFGIDYVEGGYPGANPTDTAFFAQKRTQRSRFVAFGMTKRVGVSASNDPGLAALVQAKSDAICFVAKSWDYHVRVALGCTNEENLEAIRASVEAARRRRQGADGRLRAFLRRLQGQSGLCAGLRASGLRCRRALGGAVRHQWRHAAVGGRAPSSARSSPPASRATGSASMPMTTPARRWPIR